MLIVKLQGGLGNQMFQYALARNIENITGQTVYFDVSFKQMSTETPRQYALQSFLASNSFMKADLKALPLVFRYPPGDFLKKIFKAFRNKGWFNRNWKYITETDFQLSNLKDYSNFNLYLDGFWQSEKYFRNIRPILLNDFSLKNASTRFQSLAKQMNSSNSVCIHVRHGDYLSDKATNAFHGVCSPEYYQQALNLVHDKVSNPKFYIFTDDTVWAQQHFTNAGLAFELVSEQGFTDQEELVLMSSCHHQIIANSSFSWWGAWLNKSEEKIVIAPKTWFNLANTDTELIPANWIIL